MIAVVFGTGAFQDYSAPTPTIPVATSSPSPQVQIGGASATEVPAPQQDEQGVEIETEEKTQVQSQPQIPYPTALPDLSGEKTGDDKSGISTTTRPDVSGAERPTNPPVPETQPGVQPPSQPDVGDDIAPQATDTVAPTQEPDTQKPGSGENEASPTIEPENTGGGGSGEEIRATMYGIGKTTIYFQVTDAQELAAVAELAREYGEVSASDTSVTIKVPNENYAPLLRDLYTQQVITQTGSNHEPVAETDPAVSEATDYVYIVVSI